jgi:hypothetical protein
MRYRMLALSILCVSLLWGSVGVLLGWASQGGGERQELLRFSGFYPVLNKRVTFDARTRPSEIVVRVEGLRREDVVVVRSQGDAVSVWAGSVSGRVADLFHKGLDIAPLPSSCVRVEGATVSVRRPAEIERVVFFEVHVPTGIRVHLVREGQTLLRARLSEPIALRQDAIEPGTRNPAETFLRALFGQDMPDVLRPPFPDQPYVVSFRRLAIRKKVPVNLPPGERLFVSLVINADGTVAEVTPLAPEGLAPEVERAVRQWEFEPFVFDGQAVRVRTIARIP